MFSLLCSVLYVLRTDFLFRRRDREIYSKCADAEMEKERVQSETKMGI